jgi:hypothetical protein
MLQKRMSNFAARMEETAKDKVSNLKDRAVLEDFEYVLKEVPGLPPKRDIDFSILSSSSVKDSLQNEYTIVEGVANAS